MSHRYHRLLRESIGFVAVGGYQQRWQEARAMQLRGGKNAADQVVGVRIGDLNADEFAR